MSPPVQAPWPCSSAHSLWLRSRCSLPPYHSQATGQGTRLLLPAKTESQVYCVLRQMSSLSDACHYRKPSSLCTEVDVLSLLITVQLQDKVLCSCCLPKQRANFIVQMSSLSVACQNREPSSLCNVYWGRCSLPPYHSPATRQGTQPLLPAKTESRVQCVVYCGRCHLSLLPAKTESQVHCVIFTEANVISLCCLPKQRAKFIVQMTLLPAKTESQVYCHLCTEADVLSLLVTSQGTQPLLPAITESQVHCVMCTEADVLLLSNSTTEVHKKWGNWIGPFSAMFM